MAKEITAGFIFSWIFGIIFLIVALGGFLISFLSGLCYLIVGLILLPPINKIVEKKFDFKLSKGLKTIIIIICLVLPVFIDGTNSEPNTETNKDLATQQAVEETKKVEEPKETVYTMNQDIKVDYLTYKITKAERFSEMGSSMFKKEADGIFVKVYLEITNNAKETKDIFSPRFTLLDDKGRKYDRISDDMMYISDYLEFGKQLQPGVTTKGAIVFETAKDSNQLGLIIKGDWISFSEVSVLIDNVNDIGKDTTQQDEQDKMMDEMMGDAQAQVDAMMEGLI